MNSIRDVFTFGWPYLRRYWRRLLTGIIFGVFFGLSSGSFIWATRTLVERLSTEPRVVHEQKLPKTPKFFEQQLAPLKENLSELKEKTNEFIDPWLPRAGVE